MYNCNDKFYDYTSFKYVYIIIYEYDKINETLKFNSVLNVLYANNHERVTTQWYMCYIKILFKLNSCETS